MKGCAEKKLLSHKHPRRCKTYMVRKLRSEDFNVLIRPGLLNTECIPEEYVII